MVSFDIPDYSAASSSILLVISFIVTLVALHFLLLRLWPLSVRAWKMADYVWLTVAAIGLFGSAVQNRQEIAKVRFESEGTLAAYFERSFYAQVEHWAPSKGCQYLEMNSYVRITQSEGQEICRYLQSLKTAAVAPDHAGVVDESRYLVTPQLGQSSILLNYRQGRYFNDRPPSSNSNVERIYQDLIENAESYFKYTNDDKADWSAAQQTLVERTMLGCSPFLLVFALALRLTKVTAEVVATK
jgi:hypothetical protein